MPEKHNKQSSFMNIIKNYGFKLVFNIVVLLIFIGDLVVLFFKSIITVSKYIFETFQVGITDTLGGIKNLFNSISESINQIFQNTVKYSERITNKRKKVKEKKTIFKLSSYSFKTKLKYFFFGLFAALLVIFVQGSYNFVSSLPNPKLIGNVNFPVSTQIYDRNGKLLYDVFRDQDRTPVELDGLPDYVIQATLAIEDKNFYNHIGISPIGGILRAVKDSITTGNIQGGSTITQQLVKTSLLTPERTIERKIREAILALWTERIFSKSEILQMYLNQVSYGGQSYGIEEAAKTYFNKSASDLTLGESAMLAGLTRAPTTYSPYTDPQRANQRRAEVLKNMFDQGYIDEDQYKFELSQKVQIQPPKTFIRAPHFVFYVISKLEEKYGLRRVEEGGLRVITTLDLDIQEQAEDILNEELTKIENLNVTNGAVLVTAPSTGEILAMVGSRDYFDEPYGAYNVTVARRQPGSSIKPLMYSLALERQYTGATIIQDSPVVFEIPGGRPYRPVNYDNRFHGSIPLRYALANSYNVPAVKVLNTLGVKDFINHAESLGISTWDTPERYGLSLTLGGAEVTMTDMAVAYGVFANYGKKVPLNPFITIKDFRGDVLYSFTVDEAEEVLSPQTSFIISDILSDNFARQFAFGTQSDLVIPGYNVAVKTGTTNSKRDNWTVGYNRKYLTTVWVGNNDNSPMHPTLTSGVTGASPIWNRVMTYILTKNININSEIQPPSEFSIPPGIISKQCYFGKTEYFKLGTESTSCGGKIFGVSPTSGVERQSQPTQPPVEIFNQ